MDKIKINNQVVLMRKFVKQAKIHSMNKYAKEIKILQSKKGNENQMLKYKRKAQRLLEKIALLKKIQPDYLSKLALSKAKDWASILQQKNSTLQDQCLALLANNSSVQREVEKFHTENSYLVSKIPGLILEWEIKCKNANSNKKAQNRSDKPANPNASKEDSFSRNVKQDKESVASPIKKALNKIKSQRNSSEYDLPSSQREEEQQSVDGDFFEKTVDSPLKRKKGSIEDNFQTEAVSDLEDNFKAEAVSDSEDDNEDDDESNDGNFFIKSNRNIAKNDKNNIRSKINKSNANSPFKNLNKLNQSSVEGNLQSRLASDSEDENESDDEREDFFMKTNSEKDLNKEENDELKNANYDSELQNSSDSENESLNSDETNVEETESSSEIEEGSLDIRTKNGTGVIINEKSADNSAKPFTKQTKNAVFSKKFQSGKKEQSKNKQEKTFSKANTDTYKPLSSMKSKHLVSNLKSSHKNNATSENDIYSRLLKLSENPVKDSRKSPEPSLSHKTDPFFITGDLENISADETTNFNKRDRFRNKDDYDRRNKYNQDKRDRFGEKPFRDRFSKFRHPKEILNKFSPKSTFRNKVENRTRDTHFKHKKPFENSEKNQKLQFKSQKQLKTPSKDSFSNKFNKNKSVEIKNNFQSKAKNIGEKSDEPLHPSWQAKRKLKEAVKSPFAGKRIVFDD